MGLLLNVKKKTRWNASKDLLRLASALEGAGNFVGRVSAEPVTLVSYVRFADNAG
jgi:hypothetical protein